MSIQIQEHIKTTSKDVVQCNIILLLVNLKRSEAGGVNNKMVAVVQSIKAPKTRDQTL